MSNMIQDNNTIKSIRPFIGAIDYENSKLFYEIIGFKVTSLSEKMSLCQLDSCCFYLQNYAVKDWIDNSMVFLEIDDPEGYYEVLKNLNLNDQFPTVKLKPMVVHEWGKEFFLHDPSNILWHIGCFYK